MGNFVRRTNRTSTGRLTGYLLSETVGRGRNRIDSSVAIVSLGVQGGSTWVFVGL